MPLRIGPLIFDLPLAQAALSGYSDAPMRRLARRMGAVYALAEVLIDRFAVEAQSDTWVRRHLRLADDDHPIGGQLMGSEPTQFQFAARRLVQAGYDVIDINFGCPVKSAIGGCRGGYHLGQRKRPWRSSRGFVKCPSRDPGHRQDAARYRRVRDQS